MKRLVQGLVGATALALALPAAVQAAWPEKPIRVVVPFAAGGTSDQVARMFQRVIQEDNLLPHPLTVINVTGHFSIGARQLMESEPDGYNFLVLHIALMGGEAAGLIDFGYRDFEAVAATGEFCLTPAVMEDAPWQTLEELLTAAKDNPDSILFGVNLGAINHMAAIMMQNAEPGAQFRFVQIGGGAENYAALTGRQTQAAIFSGAEYQSFKGGGVKALGYTGAERHPVIGEIPTLHELGYDVEFCIANWWFAPKGTPQEAIDGLAAALGKAMENEWLRQQYEERLFGTVFLQGEELKRSLDETFARIEPVARQASQR